MSVVIFIFIAVVLSVIGQICVKYGINLQGNIDFSSGLLVTYIKLFITPFVLLGSFIYTLSIFFWIYSLSKVDLSFAYPFLALSYILIALASWLLLGEDISLLRWVGITVICFGVLIVSKS